MTSPAESLNPVVAYYDSGRKTYWILDAHQEWIEVTETSLKRHLREAGVSAKMDKDDVVSEIDAALNRYQMKDGVMFAGALAGYDKGIHTVCGQKILVTSSPKPMQPKDGKFPVLQEFMYNLFYDEHYPNQSDYFNGWVLTAHDALVNRCRRPGQALALAGPRNCGKSLLQNLITQILGGRSAKPYRYMAALTAFNGELFNAEHLMIEDEAGSSDLRVRREFGSRIKDLTVNSVQSCHPKNRQAISLEPFWRLSISLNDEDENLMVLPPIDESLSDKLILLKAHAHDMPMETESFDGRQAFYSKLMEEIPCYLYWLKNSWRIPDTLRCQRFGIKSWMHPGLLESIDAMSPEIRLLNLIDDTLFKDPDVFNGHIDCTAVELEKQLLASEWSHEAKRILSWNNACGTYLGRLAQKKPHRVTFARTESKRTWTIQRAVKNQESP